MIGQISLALTSTWSGITSLLRSSLVAPIALYAVVQALFLVLVVNFYVPYVSGALAPMIRILGGGAAVHYPQLFVVLPAIFNKFNVVLGATLGAYVWGVAVIAVSNRFAGTVESPWRAALDRFPRLFVAQLPIVLIVVAMYLVPELLGGTEPRGNAKRLVLYGPIALSVLAESLFMFAPIAVMLEGRGAISAIGRSLEVWRWNAITALILVGLTTIPHLPVYWALLRASSIATRFSPETMLVVVGGDVLLRVFTNVVLIVAGTLVFLEMSRRERI